MIALPPSNGHGVDRRAAGAIPFDIFLDQTNPAVVDFETDFAAAGAANITHAFVDYEDLAEPLLVVRYDRYRGRHVTGFIPVEDRNSPDKT